MATTYTCIATYTAPSNVANFTLSGIPQTYTDLVMVINGGIDSGYVITARLNNDSNTNYSATQIVGGSDTSKGSTNYTGFNKMYLVGGGYGITNYGLNNNAIIHFMNYSDTNTYKTILERNNSQLTGALTAAVWSWRNTSAITSIYIYEFYSGNILSGTTFALYGIKAA